MNYCVECSYYERGITPLCAHEETRDIVTGEKEPCRTVRVIGACGKDGNFFEPKDEQGES